MKFLIGADVPPDPNSGAAGTVYYTNQALRELGHEVDEIWQDDLPHRIRHGNLHYLLELPRGYRDAVRRRCAQKDYDVIMLSQPHAWLAAKDHRRSGRPGIFLNRSHGWEILADRLTTRGRRLLGMPEKRFPMSIVSSTLRILLHRQSWQAVKYAHGVVVPSEDIRDHLTSEMRAPVERVCVSHHGVHPCFLTPPARPLTEERLRRILYVGQFAFIKGPHVLAKAVSMLLATHPEMSMTWVCAKKHHSGAASLMDSNVQARVTFHDWVSQDELTALYDSHGLFLFPSFYEGAGKAALEAMARGMCVIASDVGAMRDYIQQGARGRVVPPGNIDGFVRSANNLIETPDAATDIAAKAAAFASTRSWERCAQGIANFAHGLVNRTQSE